MEYKGYDLRFNVRWLVNGQTHDAAVGVFKDGKLLAPCDTLKRAQDYVDMHIRMEERIGRREKDGKAGGKRDTKRAKDMRE